MNKKFNEYLQKLTPENANSVILNLGKPSDKLLFAGIEDKELRLYGNKLLKKVKKHGFNFSDVMDLPMAVHDPIAVFNGNHSGSYSILTELKINGNNVLVSLEVGKGRDANYNIVTSIYGKANNSVVGWIEKGYLLYIDKEKALNYLSTPAPIADAIDNQGHTAIINIIQKHSHVNTFE